MSLVKELMDAAAQEQDSLALLRKALIVSQALDAHSFTEWVLNEQNGYTGRIPPYRLLEGDIVVRYSDTTPWQCHRVYDGQPMQVYECREALSLIVSMHSQCLDKRSVYFELLPALKEYLSSTDPSGEYRLRVSTDRLFQLIDKVKNIVAQWSISLAKGGIKGDSNSFTQEEIQIAQPIAANYYGCIIMTGGKPEMINQNIIGDNAQNVQVQQGTLWSSQTQNIQTDVNYEKAREILDEILKYQPMFKDAFGEHADELQQAIDSASDAVQKKDHPRLKGAWEWIKSTTSKAAGTLIATGILGLINQLQIN